MVIITVQFEKVMLDDENFVKNYEKRRKILNIVITITKHSKIKLDFKVEFDDASKPIKYYFFRSKAGLSRNFVNLFNDKMPKIIDTLQMTNYVKIKLKTP
jgi:hypothetical protein